MEINIANVLYRQNHTSSSSIQPKKPPIMLYEILVCNLPNSPYAMNALQNPPHSGAQTSNIIGRCWLVCHPHHFQNKHLQRFSCPYMHAFNNMLKYFIFFMLKKPPTIYIYPIHHTNIANTRTTTKPQIWTL